MIFRGTPTYFILFLLISSLWCAKASAESLCADLFADSLQLKKSAEVSIRELAKLKLRLDLAKVQEPNTIELTALMNAYSAKEKELAAYLELKNVMTSDELITQIKLQILDLQNNPQRNSDKESKEDDRRRSKEQIQKIKESNNGLRMNFGRIRPGSYKMGLPEKTVDVTLTKPFELMTTLLTHFVWHKVIQLGKEKLSSTNNFGLVVSKGPTHPQVSISFPKVTAWIAELNELSQRGEPALNELIVGHKKGDIYRLPTEAEWEFVVRNQGQHNDNFYFGLDKSLIGEYVWNNKNAEGSMPVALKLPVIVDGTAFYDLNGNVGEWTSTRFSNTLWGGIDPQGPPTGDYQVVRGGKAIYKFNENYRGGNQFEHGYEYVGFRLLREVKP